MNWSCTPSGGRRETVEFTVVDVNPAMFRVLFNIPDGFPLWYRTPQLALPVGPLGRIQARLEAELGFSLRVTPLGIGAQPCGF
jgi:hypothetical protein